MAWVLISEDHFPKRTVGVPLGQGVLPINIHTSCDVFCLRRTTRTFGERLGRAEKGLLSRLTQMMLVAGRIIQCLR